ncbi:MAG: CPBP family intramembrane metalloprotease [Actinobacteria bacterium]|nr:CPBP family intramembrane metalloprotease [Actinomycetota bacterium]
MPERPERPWLDPATHRWGLGEVGVGLVAAFLLAQIALSILDGVAGWTDIAQAPMWGQAVVQVPLWGGYLGSVVWAGTKGSGVVGDFGLTFRPIDVPIGLPIGVALQLLVLPVLYGPILWLTRQDQDQLSAPARELSDKAHGPWGWVLFALIVVVGAPLVEELFFRGLLLRSLQKRGLSDVWSCVACAAVFAAIHLQPLQFAGLFVAGLVFSVLAVRTGRLGPSILTHAGFNGASVVLLYLHR